MMMISQFEDQWDDNNAICPYCHYGYQVEAEDYSENPREEECDECGRKFWVEQHFSVSTQTTPDCSLNGKKHDWRLRDVTGGSAFFCTTCHKCSLVAEDGTPAKEKEQGAA